MRISLCMIVKNEAAVLGRCLESVKDAVDEIVIIDTGSTDETKDIAGRYTEQIYDFPWVDDFSAARNFSFSKATMDFVMWMDADDVLPPSQAAGLVALKESLPPETDMVTMKYHLAWDAQGRASFVSTRERLLRRTAGFQWEGRVHECIPMVGAVVHTPLYLEHRSDHGKSDRNLKIYEMQKAEGLPFSPREMYYYARELVEHGRHSEAAVQFEAFLDSGEGWFEDNIGACLALGDCYGRLGEAQQQRLALSRSFAYAPPRAQVCCALGYEAKKRGEWDSVAFWFEAALLTPTQQSFGFEAQDMAEYVPHLELCVCYDRLGQRERAVVHNEAAGACKPDSKAVAQNQLYFAD